jgi:hypothetical protein
MPTTVEPAARRPFSIGGCIVWIGAGIIVVVFVAALLPKIAESYPGLPLLSQMFVTPQTVYSTSMPVPAQQQPAAQPAAAPQPRYTPFYGPTDPSEGGAVGVPEQPTATLGPTPGAFWTEEERAAFTATAEAWYDPATLPTAEPAFVEYVAKACSDPELVEASATLQLFCKK